MRRCYGMTPLRSKTFANRPNVVIANLCKCRHSPWITWHTGLSERLSQLLPRLNKTKIVHDFLWIWRLCCLATKIMTAKFDLETCALCWPNLKPSQICVEEAKPTQTLWRPWNASKSSQRWPSAYWSMSEAPASGTSLAALMSGPNRESDNICMDQLSAVFRTTLTMSLWTTFFWKISTDSQAVILNRTTDLGYHWWPQYEETGLSEDPVCLGSCWSSIRRTWPDMIL